MKLADFGTSIWLSNGYQQDNMPRGTEPFMAPEVNSGGEGVGDRVQEL